MKDILRHITIATIGAMALVLPVSCSDDDGPAERPATLYDIVEYTGNDKGQTSFRLYAPDADIPVTLTSASSLDMGKLAEGECVLLGYTPRDGKAYTSGIVDVTGFAAVTNGSLMKGPWESLEGWDKDEVYLESLWRAGGYIDMRFQLVYDNEPRVFRLVVDEATIENEYPDAYLVNIRKGDYANFMRQYYAAFDLSALWSYDSVKGLRVHVNNSNNRNLRLFVVEKPSNKDN